MGMEFESRKRQADNAEAKIAALQEEIAKMRTEQAQQIADLQEVAAELAEQQGGTE